MCPFVGTRGRVKNRLVLPIVLLLSLSAAADGRVRQTQVQSLPLQIEQLALADQRKVEQLRSQWDGLFSNNISDLEVLGIGAVNEEERRRYAEQFARRYRALTRGALMFDREVRAAHRRLYGERPVLAPERWYRSGFVWTLRPGGEADDERVLERVLAAAAAGHSSQVRLLTDDKAAAMLWMQGRVPVDLLRSGKISVSMTSSGAAGVVSRPQQDPQQKQ